MCIISSAGIDTGFGKQRERRFARQGWRESEALTQLAALPPGLSDKRTAREAALAKVAEARESCYGRGK